MSGETRFDELPERAVFWCDGGLYEKTGRETALHQATGGIIRFYGADWVYPLGRADSDEDDGTKTELPLAAAAV